MAKQFVSFERLQQYDILIKAFIEKFITAANGDIATLETAIEILNGDKTTEGSVQKQITDAINDFASKVSDDNTINTFKELVDYVAQHGQDYTAIFQDVKALEEIVGVPATSESSATGLHKALEDAIENNSNEFNAALEDTKAELLEAIEDASEEVLNTVISANSGEDGDIVAYLGGTVGDPTIALTYEFCSDVDVRKLFAEPYVVTIGGENGENLADAVSVLATNEDVFEAQLTLAEAAPVTSLLNVPAGKSLTIDLNGQDLTNADGTSLAQLINVVGELTITDSTVNARTRSIGEPGKIVNTVSGKAAIKLASTSAVLNIEGGVIESTGSTSNKAISCINGVVNMSGGKVLSSGTGIDGKNINISGGEVTAEGIAVSGCGTISGGVITSNTSYGVYANTSNAGFEITGGSITGNESKGAVGVYTGNVLVTEGAVLNTPVAFASNASGLVLAGTADKYIPESVDLEIYNNAGELVGYFTSATTATSCSAMAGATVKLSKDINRMYNIIGYDTTVDLNGHNITSTDVAAIMVKAGSGASKVRNVNIVGNGNVSCDNGGGCVAVYVDRYAHVNINGGNYSVNGDADNAVVYIANSYKTAPTVVEVNGGTYQSGDGKWVLNIKDEHRASENEADNAKFIVTGGTFVGFDPSDCISEGEHTNFVADGYECFTVEGSNEFIVKPRA